MNETGKDTRFDLVWVLVGALVMFATSFVGGLVMGALGVTGVWANAIGALVCFAIGGYIIGKKSEGQTILEAGIAAVLILIVVMVIRGMKFPDDPVVILLGFGVPFLAALFGAWLGEK